VSQFKFRFGKNGTKPKPVGAKIAVEADADLPEINQRPGEGMNENACASYGLGSRLRCARCGGQPRILSATGIENVTVSVACCGQQETRTIERKELTFTQYFFEE